MIASHTIKNQFKRITEKMLNQYLLWLIFHLDAVTIFSVGYLELSFEYDDRNTPNTNTHSNREKNESPRTRQKKIDQTKALQLMVEANKMGKKEQRRGNQIEAKSGEKDDRNIVQ